MERYGVIKVTLRVMQSRLKWTALCHFSVSIPNGDHHFLQAAIKVFMIKRKKICCICHVAALISVWIIFFMIFHNEQTSYMNALLS